MTEENIDTQDFKDIDQFNFNFDDAFDEAMERVQGGFQEMDDGPDPGIFLPNTEGTSEFLPPDPEKVPVIPDQVDWGTDAYFERPKDERIVELFGYMHPHRRVLLTVLEAAYEPISHTDLGRVADEARAHKFSVYSHTNIVTMLETSGALMRVTEDGTPIEDFEQKPNIVIIDGEEYWEPADSIEPYWVMSPEGKAYLESNDPLGKLARQLAREPEYLVIYKRVLMQCADGAKTMKQLSEVCDTDPILNTAPRKFFVQHFVEALERCECVDWNGKGWMTTKTGLKGLEEQLNDVDDPEPEKYRSLAAELETQGVNW